MPKKKDWTGYKYNTFEVIGEDIECNNLLKARVKAGEIKKFNRHYLCKCECGNVISVTANQIAKNRPWSCGCKEIRNSEDLTGKTFGDWTVLSENTERRQSDKENLKTFRTYWNCRCKCGKIKVVSTSHLKDGKSTGCGCTRDAKVSEMRRHDLLGKTFGKLTAIEDAGYKISHGRKLYRWKCRCECGDVSVYTVDDLMSRKITECTKCRAQGFPSVKAKATYNKNQQKIKEEGSLWESLREKYSEEEINDFWSIENCVSPKELTKKSHINIILRCPRCGQEYRTSGLQLYERARDIMCPSCSQKESSSSYERTVKDYLNNSLHLETLHENECNLKPINPKTGYLLRYDNEVVDYKLIIEVHSIQHYTSDIPERWADGKDKQKLFEERKYRDNFKKEYALKNGYDYLALSYVDINNGSYKNIINKKLTEIEQRGESYGNKFNA